MVNDSMAQNPTASLDSITTAFAVEVNGDGCYAKDTVIIFINFIQECLEICNNVYNGITPNADGENDTWHIDGIQSFPDNEVTIFNRWGNRVWSGTGYNNNGLIWNGDNDKGEHLPNGTYYYVIDLNWQDKHMQCVGWVEITR